jgi:hypothetical protein
VYGPPEVGERELSVQSDEDALRLQVAVDDVLCVHPHLTDEARGGGLIEPPSVVEQFEERTRR